MSRSPSWLIQVWSKSFGLTGPCPFSAQRCCLGCATSFEHVDPVNFRARILHLLLVNIWRCAAYFFTEKSLLTAVCYVDLPGSWMVVLSLLECVDEIQPFSIQSLWIFGRSPDGASTEATITQSRKRTKTIQMDLGLAQRVHGFGGWLLISGKLMHFTGVVQRNECVTHTQHT